MPGILVLVQGFPPNWRYVRERERDRQHRNGLAEPGVTWRAGVRSFPFWIIVAVLFVGSVTVNGAVTQMVALLTDRAISVRAAALCASMLGASSLGGRLFVGWLLDHFTGSREAFAVTLLPATGVLLLAGLTALPMASLAAALNGIWSRRGGGYHALPADPLLWFALVFDPLGVHLDVLRHRGATGPVVLGRAL